MPSTAQPPLAHRTYASFTVPFKNQSNNTGPSTSASQPTYLGESRTHASFDFSLSKAKLSCAQGKCAGMATCCNCSSQSEHATVGDGVIFLLYKRGQRLISRLSRTFTEEIKILRTWLGEVPALPQLALSAWVRLNKVKFCRIFLRFANMQSKGDGVRNGSWNLYSIAVSNKIERKLEGA